MKIALCATHLFNMTLPQDRDYIGVDHGIEELLKQEITPRFAIGVSVTSFLSGKIWIFKSSNDFLFCKESKSPIANLGVTGGRLDHFFAVMCLLEKYQDVSIKVIDQQNCIQLLKPGIHHIYNQEYYYFSLFSIIVYSPLTSFDTHNGSSLLSK